MKLAILILFQDLISFGTMKVQPEHSHLNKSFRKYLRHGQVSIHSMTELCSSKLS